ncbi:hypothetical protein C0966_17145 (plasmid) [Bacillus methanolicus]|uniref:hypothetical protein n=1 Tax=Bacillus methanolicus TaxID=1471 RepID=UPI002380ACF5|nr:hypothetical protein [Bacillus methanolicus]MDE3840992.1 hypothetical protein [Bacillus methanolicus]
MDKLLHWFWHLGVDYFLYCILLASSLWTSKNIMYTSLKNKYTQWNYKYRIRKVRSKVFYSKETSYKNPLLKHLNLLIKTTRDERNDYDVPVFLFLSGLLGVISAIFIFVVFGDILIAVIFGILLSLIPYLILRLRLNKIRYLMSLEFLYIVQRLTQNYNAMHYDMYHALSETQKEVKNTSLKKVIVKLISDLQVSRNETELRESIQVFTYTAGTNWSKRLGSIILKAYLYNEKVLNALIVLSKQMEETEEMLEEEKSYTLDTVYNGYVTVPVFIGSLLLGYYTSGAQDWTKLQFGTQWTLLNFLLCVLGVIFSIIISIFLKRPKNDL